jgi:catechol 2,3-dioxygenase-like lactoylglutathione lyase family enzyme
VSDPAGLQPARRFLHVCYCCDDVEPVTDFFVGGLGMKNVMRTPLERSPGTILGLDEEVYGQASFVYDHRGPRSSPAIEIQSWLEPKLEGAPSLDPFEAGIKALGFAVPDLAAAEQELVGRGCSVVSRGPSPYSPTWLGLRDSRGLPIELVEDSGLAAGVSRMAHLRITATDIDASMPFYEALGFTVTSSGAIEGAGFAGHDGPATGRFVRLQLPDEPFAVLLTQWTDPASHGRHYANPYHAGIFRAALGVDDTRVAHEALVAAGFTFDRAPMSVELRGTPVPDMWICFISDPDGVPYEFVQRPRSAFR